MDACSQRAADAAMGIETSDDASQSPLRWRHHDVTMKMTTMAMTTPEKNVSTNLPAWLQGLAAESGLWANAGGRFGDLSDARAWLAQSPAAAGNPHSVTPPPLFQLAPRQDSPPTPMPWTDRVGAYADASVACVLAPFLRCCEMLDALQEIQASTLCSRIMVVSMLQVFVLVSLVAARLRHYYTEQIVHTWTIWTHEIQAKRIE